MIDNSSSGSAANDFLIEFPGGPIGEEDGSASLVAIIIRASTSQDVAHSVEGKGGGLTLEIKRADLSPIATLICKNQDKSIPS